MSSLSLFSLAPWGRGGVRGWCSVEHIDLKEAAALYGQRLKRKRGRAIVKIEDPMDSASRIQYPEFR
jgi:hypothetical protein